MNRLFEGSIERPVTFAELKPRLMNLVMNALQIETDPHNTHMLLGGLFFSVQDAATFEKIEQVMQPASTDTSSSLLTSGKIPHASITIYHSTFCISHHFEQLTLQIAYFYVALLYFMCSIPCCATLLPICYVVSDTASTMSATSSSDHHSLADSLGPDLSDIQPGMLYVFFAFLCIM